MIYTSYFAFVKNVPSEFLISIAGKSVPGFRGTEYRKLCPQYEWWKQWHDEKLSDEWYVQKYYATVLNKLNPVDVLRELGDNKILLCWETPEKFCHRHLVAEWLNKKTGADIKELSIITKSEFIK